MGSTALTTGNNNFGITQLHQPVNAVTSIAASILPMGSYNGSANPLTIASHWIYKLTNANNYSQWTQVGSATAIAPGEGFTMKGTSGSDTTDPEGTGIVNNPGNGAQRYDFKGKPNDGNITVSVGSNDAATLTGNPYPSALHLNAFLLDPTNTNATGIAYFWQQDKTVNSHYLSAYKGGYAAYSPISLESSGIYTAAAFKSYNEDGSVNNNPATGTSPVIERKYIPIGQGFVINGSSSGNVTFKNAHRAFYKEGGSLSHFEKPAKNLTAKAKDEIKDYDGLPPPPPMIPYFKINAIINNEFTRQIALAFISEATDGIDKGIDAKNMDGNLPNDVSFWIENQNFVIQGINFDLSKRIPLSLKAATHTTFKFYIAETKDFDDSLPIYLYDQVDMSYHDIKNGVYEVKVSPGIYTQRFKIIFAAQSLGTNKEFKSNFFILQDNENQVLIATNPNSVAIKNFTLYDILGRSVLSKNNLGNEQRFTFSTAGLSSGIYVAMLQTDDNARTTQKVIISNSVKH